MRYGKRHCSSLVAALVASWATGVYANGTVWLPAPGAGSVTASYVSQSADDFWHIVDGQMAHTPFPPGLEQTTTFISATYGLADAWAVDAQVGMSEASNKANPAPHPTLDGRTDLGLGITWRFADEVLSDGPSMAVRFGMILAGDYETYWPTAIGEGADGVELSGIIGKVFGDRLALSAEVGTRNRTSDVPQETFINFDAHLIAGQHLVLSANYHIQDSAGDQDIHGPGFTRFVLPFVAEDVNRVSLGGTLSFDRFSVGLRFFDVVDGRNTADFDAVSGTFTYNFGR